MLMNKLTLILLGALSLAFPLACVPGSGSTTSDGATTADTTTAGTSGDTTSTQTSDTSTDTTVDPTTSPSTSDTETSTTTTGDTTTTTGTTTTGDTTTTDGSSTGDTTGGVCGGGWCSGKEFANVIIYDNHDPPHELLIPAADVEACVERTYDIQGDADHNHTITLTPQHFAAIDAGGQIDLVSSEAQGHTHEIWSDCE